MRDRPLPRLAVRLWLLLLGPGLPAAIGLAGSSAEPSPDYAAVRPGVAVDPARDAGAHPDFRTEWWYVTGWLSEAGGRESAFQITFFRTRPAGAATNPSRFAAHELVIAHAALLVADGTGQWHAEKIARSGFGLAHADVDRLSVAIDDWHLTASGPDLSATAGDAAGGFALRLRGGSALLNGVDGFSQKGPDPASASYYVSVPQLVVEGTVRHGTASRAVTGRAWLDHEWSSRFLDPAAVGWDWVGLNLDDGGALVAFRLRTAANRTHYAGATWRRADGVVRHFGPDGVRFVPGRVWRSPRTGIAYPVAGRVTVGEMAVDLVPFTDDQEADTRRTTGAVYWEGAVRAVGPSLTGRGFLELTGYGTPLVLP